MSDNVTAAWYDLELETLDKDIDNLKQLMRELF